MASETVDPIDWPLPQPLTVKYPLSATRTEKICAVSAGNRPRNLPHMKQPPCLRGHSIRMCRGSHPSPSFSSEVCNGPVPHISAYQSHFMRLHAICRERQRHGRRGGINGWGLNQGFLHTGGERQQGGMGGRSDEECRVDGWMEGGVNWWNEWFGLQSGLKGLVDGVGWRGRMKGWEDSVGRRVGIKEWNEGLGWRGGMKGWDGELGWRGGIVV